MFIQKQIWIPCENPITNYIFRFELSDTSEFYILKNIGFDSITYKLVICNWRNASYKYQLDGTFSTLEKAFLIGKKYLATQGIFLNSKQK